MTDNELIDKTDRAIAELVYSKTRLQKAFNYYNGKRDEELFRYLEENMGIGNPTSVEFTPLIKKHIDALIGEFLDTPILPKVFCKDSDTLSAIERERLLQVNVETVKFLREKLQNDLMQVINGLNPQDTSIKEELDKLIEDVNDNFVSQYEIAAQNVIEYIMLSRSLDMTTKLKTLFLNLLISGYTFYKVKETQGGNNLTLDVISPLNAFVDKNPESIYVNRSNRAVVRRWYTKDEVMNKYGKELSAEDRKHLEDIWDKSYSSTGYFVRSFAGYHTPGIQADTEIIPGYPTDERYNNRLFEVYEVEWIETDKDFVKQRYSTVRISDDVYILYGKDEKVIRSKSDPTDCTLSLNGVYFLNESKEPYSLALACASLLDKYDLLNFYRDNLIATSGTTGDWIDMSMIPKDLGVKWPERVEKWIAYKKAGTALIDTSLEGRMANGQAPLNTIFQGFDDTVKVQSIQAIQLAIDSIEQTCSSITGVFKERLNGIQQRDAVTNVQTSVNNSFTITKQYYHQMDLVVNEMLLDCLNTAKRVFKKGVQGTIILGDKQVKVFTALPEYFTVSDWDIRIITTSEVAKEIEELRQSIPLLIQSQLVPADMILEMITSKNLPDLKYKLKKAFAKLKAENNLLQQLQQLNLQLLQQMQQAQQEAQKLQQQVQQLQQQDLQFRQTELQEKMKVEWYKAETDRLFKTSQAKIEQDKVEIEQELLYDGNPYNDEVKD